MGATQANDGVTLAMAPGEIHALIGENGAGKSTLMRITCGLLRPDAGRIAWNGADVPVMDLDTARRLGIAMVFQHFSLFETLTVAENVALSLRTREPLPALARRITAVAARYGRRCRRGGTCMNSRSASASGSRSCAASCRSRIC